MIKIKNTCILICLGFIFTALAAAQPVSYTLIPESPRPGEPVTIGVSVAANQAVLLVNGNRLARTNFFPVPAADGKPGFMAAILTIPSTARTGTAAIRLESERGLLVEIPVIIANREFASDVIHLNQALTDIRTDSSTQRTTEADRLWAILSTTGTEIYHTGNFLLPVLSVRRTSFFGDRRVFQYPNGNRDTSIHAGVDFGVPTGTQVIASGAGKVVLAGMRIVTGNSIVIEHAPGVYSLYYHMDRIDVRENTIINAGASLGTSGATGLATGPHLHWEIRVNTENTDPDAFIARPILDKDLIISKIYNVGY